MKVGTPAADAKLKAQQAQQLEKTAQHMQTKAKELKAKQPTNLEPQTQAAHAGNKLNLKG
jgi:hypothetical protein